MKVACKGTVLQLEIATVFTAISQVLSLDVNGSESETFEATTLDTAGAGKEHEPTGYSEGGDVSGELFYDPVLAGHQAVTDLIAAPAKANWKIIFADTANTELPFTSAGVGFGVKVDPKDGLKGSFSAKVTGLPGWPTGA